MFHFLLILDENSVRLEKRASRAGAIMAHWRDDARETPVSNSTMRLLTWGENLLIVEDDEWRLGIGSWIGPIKQPTAAFIRAMPENSTHGYDGTYCFLAGALHDAHVDAVVDPLGRLHVYYATPSASTLLISNSALLLDALTAAECAPHSVREFLAKGTVFDQRSLFSGVEKIAPDKLYQFGPGRVQTRDIPRPSTVNPTDPPAILSAFADAVTNNLADIFKRSPRPLLDLTGGFDSRLVLACLLQLRSPKEIYTVVVGDTNSPDVLVANAIARKLGLQHRHIEAPVATNYPEHELRKALLLTDAEYDILEYVKVMRIHERLSQEFDASINGSGGEIIRDEWWQVFTRFLTPPQPWDAQRLAARRFATDAWGETMLAATPSDSLTEHFAKLIEKTVSHLGKEAHTNRLVDEVYLYMRMQRWQGRLASATHGIWPNYSPLLMQRPIQLALLCPIEMRSNGLMPRLLLEKLHRPLAEIPMVDGAPATRTTWRNLHRHLPRFRNRATYYTKALRKRLGLGAAAAATNYRGLLPTTMLSSSLYDPQALATTKHLIQKGLLSDQKIGRLFTLERTARTLHDQQVLPMEIPAETDTPAEIDLPRRKD